MSIALVHSYGLVGVAVGTLIPVGVAAAFILYPAACHRVGLSVATVTARAVWPALWPALLVGVLLALARNLSGGTLIGVALEAAAGALLYLWLFFAIAIGRSDRAMYTTKALEILGRRPLPSTI